jgi:hypothetical protein
MVINLPALALWLVDEHSFTVEARQAMEQWLHNDNNELYLNLEMAVVHPRGLPLVIATATLEGDGAVYPIAYPILEATRSNALSSDDQCFTEAADAVIAAAISSLRA